MEKFSTNILNKNLLEKLLENKNAIENKVICLEELSELQKEITKDLRGKLSKTHLIEEMVDVYIILDMLRIIYGVNIEELKNEYEKKMTRNLNRLKEE